jgi:hypothetical protein
MEILNQLLSNQADYLNALRHAQQMPVTTPPPATISNSTTNFNINSKLILRFAVVVGAIYLVYQAYKSLPNISSEEDE